MGVDIYHIYVRYQEHLQWQYTGGSASYCLDGENNSMTSKVFIALYTSIKVAVSLHMGYDFTLCY